MAICYSGHELEIPLTPGSGGNKPCQRMVLGSEKFIQLSVSRGFSLRQGVCMTEEAIVIGLGREAERWHRVSQLRKTPFLQMSSFLWKTLFLLQVPMKMPPSLWRPPWLLKVWPLPTCSSHFSDKLVNQLTCTLHPHFSTRLRPPSLFHLIPLSWFEIMYVPVWWLLFICFHCKTAGFLRAGTLSCY